MTGFSPCSLQCPRLSSVFKEGLHLKCMLTMLQDEDDSV